MFSNSCVHCLILVFLIGVINLIQPAAGQQQSELAAPKVLQDAPSDMMLEYFRNEAEELSSKHLGQTTLAEWKERRHELRDQIWQSLGNFPLKDRPAVRARITGTLDHGDHTVEKIIYESLPGLYVTALVYVPKGLTARAPAVICVNGHWRKAKATPIIQKRCARLARMGVIAFCQDVIGTGERAATNGSPPTTYHGFYRGATPRIVDRSLLGYIMYECFRANDYLRSRPDVDPSKIMATGASGGGKQSMFFPALDDRLAGSAPVCYVSSYVDHIGATACVGEIPTGVLRYTDQWEILGLHAPRPLLCLAAQQDVPVFLPKPAKRTLQMVNERVYQLYGHKERVGFAEFDSKHDYNKPMRERFYSHVAEHLLGKRGALILEPDDLPVETEETLRCGLPMGSETMQSLTFRRARELVSKHDIPRDKKDWQSRRQQMLSALEQKILGGFPTRSNIRHKQIRKLTRDSFYEEHWTMEAETGVILPFVLCLPKNLSPDEKTSALLVVDQEGKQHVFERGLVEHLVSQGHIVLAIDYRGAGETSGGVPTIGYGPGTPEYNLSNYALFLGRPLVGMRIHDVRCALDFLAARPEVAPNRISLAGRGRGALVVLLTAALDERVVSVVAEELLSSWVFAEEFVRIGLSTLIPKILTVGDIQQLAACVAPRRLLILNPVDGRNRQLNAAQKRQFWGFTKAIYGKHQRHKAISIALTDEAEVTAVIESWIIADE